MLRVVKNNLGNFLMILFIFVIVFAPVLLLLDKQAVFAQTLVTYYFNAYDVGVEEWATTPENMTNGVETNYASTATIGDIELLTGNTCPGTSLGTITKVEIRAYGYYTTSDDTAKLRPVFTGGDGNDHLNALPASAGWGSYFDITNDPNAPSWSSWLDVQNLDCDVEYYKLSKPENAFVGKVEIRVTYTPGALTVTTPSSVTFGAVNYSFTGQNNTGNTFGNGTPIQVEDSFGNGWTMVATCQDWTKGADTMDYDGDGVNTGQLTISQDSVTVTKISGQDIDPTGGPKKGTTDSFDTGTSEITIGSADSGYGQGTYDFKNYDLQQFIPGMQNSGDYTTTLTVTVS